MVLAQTKKLLPADPHLLPIAPKVLVHQVIWEGVVTGGHGRVGGEDGCVPHLLHCPVKV